MNVLFVYPNIGTLNAYHYNHGIGALSAALAQAGHQTRMLYYEELPDREAFLKKVRKIDPGMVCFSFNSHQWFYIRKLAGWLEESHPVPTVAGGVHATHAPEEVIAHPGVQMVCRGEGDEAIVELAEALELGQDPSSISNLWAKNGEVVIHNEVRPLVRDLDRLPFSDREIFDMERALRESIFEENANEMTMMAGRGCPLNCHYCCNNALMKLYRGKGAYVRFRSVDHVMSEIDLLARCYDFDTIFFEDDVFTIRKEWVEEFCKSYRRSFRFPFNIYARVEQLNRDMLAMLKDAGLYNVRVGVESGNEHIRRKVMNRRMTNTQIERMFDWFNELDIRARTFNIVGVPGDTPETIRDTIKLNERLLPDVVQVSMFYPYPGTQLYEFSRSKGYLSGEERSSFFDEQSVLDLPELPRETLKTLYKEFCDSARKIEQKKWELDMERGRLGYYDFMANFHEGQLEHGDPEMVKTSLFLVDAQRRHVIFEHPRAKLTYNEISIENETRLRFGIALSQRCLEWGGHGVRFRVLVSHNGDKHEVFDHVINPKLRPEDRCWHDFEVSLSAFGASTVSISFLTDPDESGDLTGAWAGWSRPHLICTFQELRAPSIFSRLRDKIISVIRWEKKDDENAAPLQGGEHDNYRESFQTADNTGNKTTNDDLIFPAHDSSEVKKASDYILSLTSSECRLNSFFREYFEGSLNRIAMNLVYLMQLIKPGDHFLDVGSFGIEPAIIKKEFPQCNVKALSYEGNMIGIGPEGFYETVNGNDPKCIRIEEIDVEHHRFPYSDNLFDIVTCFEVLEHLKFNPVHMMKEIKRVLKPDGIFILTTPNINSALSIIKMLIGESPQECPLFHNPLKYVKHGIDLPKQYYGVIHPKEYTITQVRDLFVSLGFHIKTIDTIDTIKTIEKIHMVVPHLHSLFSLIKSITGEPFSEPKLGEKILLVAQKGGSIISETPAALFEQ